MAAITRTLEPGITYFSAAEIRIVLLPIGEIPDDVFQRYASLVMAHRQVELSNVRSFYKESQKSPFKFFPWKTGNMHFRFLPEDSPTATTSPLAPLHSHRKVLGVIGLLSCEHTSDITRKYKEFEQRCRAFPEATTVRCLAFNPSTPGDIDAGSPGAISPSAEDTRACPDLIIFPPTTKNPPVDGQEDDHLINHMEVVMHDFAACVLASLEAWMLNASPAMVSLATLTDTPEFTGVAIPPYAAEDEAGRVKRKYARLQKSMGDYSLLAGSPLDAVDHYNTAVDLGRASLDFTIAAAAMEGYAAAKLLHAAVSNDAFVMNAASVFRDESAWRSPRHSISSSGTGGGGESTEIGRRKSVGGSAAGTPRTPKEEREKEDHSIEENGGGDKSNLEGDTSNSNRNIATGENLPIEEDEEVEERGNALNSLETSIPSNTTTENFNNNSINSNNELAAFDGSQFWDALRRSNGLEDEVRSLVDEAKGFIRKRGGLPLLVEADLRWARLLAGLHGNNARSEATELANAVQLAAEMLPLPEDRLIALTESASILGSVGAVRKRVLLMWQAVELSKYFGFPDARTLAVARSALEPATKHHQEHPLHSSLSSSTAAATAATGPSSSSSSGYNEDWDLSRPRPLDQETTIPASWGPVRAGCLEATLGLAIYAKRHADVFDAAAALLRDHSKQLSAHRMQSLLDNLVAAASQMAVNEKARPGKGPPPLLHVIGPRAMPAMLAPIWILPNRNNHEATSNSNGKNRNSSEYSPVQSPSSRGNIFLYDPFSAKRQRERNEQRKNASTLTSLVGGGCGAGGGGSGNSGIDAMLVENDSGVRWVCGEPAVLDIEVANPSSVSIKIDKMVLEAKFIPLPSSSSTPTTTMTAAITPKTTPSVPIPATKGLWKGKPVSLNIPAHTKPVRIQLEGTPLVPGILILTGCRLTAFGGVSWSQPWTGKPLNLAKQLAEASSKGKERNSSNLNSSSSSPTTAAGGGGATGGTSSSSPNLNSTSNNNVPMVSIKGPAVTILPALPRLQLELHTSAATTQGFEEKAAAISNGSSPITLLKLVHGQSACPYLVITNNGSVAVDTLRIGFGSGGGNSTVVEKTNNTKQPPISVDVDTSLLQSLLPLQPGKSISLPVKFRALQSRFNLSGASSALRGGVGGGGASDILNSTEQHQQQPFTETVEVDYASFSSQNTGNNNTNTTLTLTTSREIPGRRATLEIGVAVAPSLHVSHIEFAEVYQQQQQQQVEKYEENQNQAEVMVSCERKVLMLADVVNRGTVPLEAWLGPNNSKNTNTSNGGGDNNTEHKHVMIIAPGQRAALSYLINKEDAASLISGSNGGDGGGGLSGSVNRGGGRNAVVLRYEEKERQACATSLAERIGLHFKCHSSNEKSIGGGGSNGGGGGGMENQQSSAADNDIGSSGGVVYGSLPLIHGEIYNGLTPSVLCMLRSCAVTLGLSIAPLDSAQNEQKATPSVDCVDGNTTSNSTSTAMTESVALTPLSEGSIVLVHPPAVRAGLGQPLKVTMEVESCVDEATEVFCSFMCTSIATPPAALIHTSTAMATTTSPGGGSGGGGNSATLSPAAAMVGDSSYNGVLDTTRLLSQGSTGLYSPGAGGGLGITAAGAQTAAATAAGVISGLAGAATWTGIHSRLQISVPARGKITHVAGVAVVAPGRYRIGTGHVTVTYPHPQTEGSDANGKNTLVSVVPCFVAIE